MARHMADDSHTFRAVITEVTEHAGDYPNREYTEIYGPYRTKAAATAMITRERKSAEKANRHLARMIELGHLRKEAGRTVTVTGHVEKAITKWERV